MAKCAAVSMLSSQSEECLGWSDARALEEHERAEQVLARDFAGPAAQRISARSFLR